MRAIEKVEIEFSVILGRTSMPIHQLLRLGRGAVIMLDRNIEDEVEIEANQAPFAKGNLLVRDEKICVQLSSGHGDANG